LTEVDKYGVPIDAFGREVPPEFFEIIGRLLVVNGKIEYIKERLDHLPISETSGVRKFHQFMKRYDAGRSDRNAVVHSFWVFGADTSDPGVILGVRYKVRKVASGEIATVSIRDVTDSEREQEFIQFTPDELRKLLKRDLDTMRIGMHALTEIGLNWAAQQLK
jgi:hypothetical protein